MLKSYKKVRQMDLSSRGVFSFFYYIYFKAIHPCA